MTRPAIDPGALPYARNDNFAATIGYEDGTLASLVYTALGPKSGLGKEHITVFCDGEAFVVDDFKKLTRASDGSVLWQSGEPDKGHFEELSRFGDAIATAAMRRFRSTSSWRLRRWRSTSRTSFTDVRTGRAVA